MQALSFDFLLRNLIANLMMPPLLWIFIALVAMLFIKRHLKLQRILVGICLLMIWVTSTTAFANWFVAMSGNWLEYIAPIQISELNVNQSDLTKKGLKQNPQDQLAKDELTKDQSTVDKVDPSSGSKKQIGAEENKNNGKSSDSTLEVKSLTSPLAIVVLGGGKIKGALDRSDLMMEDLSKEELQRIRYAALLSKRTQLPILVTGGAPEPSSKYPSPEAQVMAKVLRDEFNVEVSWIEDQSKTTQENAQFSAYILQKENINHIYLVTHFWHMPRAKNIFEKYGFEVTPAPMGFEFENEFDLKELNLLDFLPSPSSLQRVREICHETIGKVWYRLRYKS
jgi:uncharacterized SAM-binding protein YcdF (DUF218 family)